MRDEQRIAERLNRLRCRHPLDESYLVQELRDEQPKEPYRLEGEDVGGLTGMELWTAAVIIVFCWGLLTLVYLISKVAP